MDVPDDNVLDVDLLPDDGSEDEGEAPPSSEFYPGPGSTPTSCTSSPRGEEPASPHGAVSQPAFFHHQGYTRPFFTGSRRGPGRPRKEGPKLTREGKIVRRYRGTAGSLRGAKRHRGSRDDALDDMMEEDDFTIPPIPEEPPYMPEKWPGKVCALCNLSERSQLGQGEMRQLPCTGEGDGSTTPVVASGGATPTSGTTPNSTPTTPVTPGLVSPPPELVDPNQHPLALPLSRRQKAFNKCKTPLYNMEHTDELSIIGHTEPLELGSIVSSSMLYIHRFCLEFTPPFQDQVASASTSDEDKEQLEEARIKGIVSVALARKCAFCTRHGASIPCKMSCSKYFHLPCILASGGFMDFQTKSSFCKDHLYQVPLVCTADIDCRTCRTIGDIANLMTCVACGAHYHGTCVGLAQLPGVRSGWACRACRACQVCRGEAGAGAAGEARAVACEHCDKLYHAACLRPVMATVPKYGWKCKCCRVCSDCGARSPGAGPSSRWHAHYTVCDSCYQQRNKGSCCPLCRRAYRAAAYRDMIRCTLCKRYVHGMCDPDAEPTQYRQKKEQNPAYEYICPICKTQMPLMSISKSGSFEEDNMASTSQDSSFGDDNSQTSEQDPLAIESKPSDVGLGKGKPFTVSSKVAKKKIGGYKLKGGFPPAGKIGFQKRQRSVLDFGRKRGSKPKMRGVFGVPGLGLQRPQAPDNKTTEDDPGVENKLILCSSKDKFVLTQDLCVMCGALGADSEGCLISCAQCGQTYHPYCVNIKVSQVIVTLGWRCLDCTVCEGCGNRGEDSLLLLCDDCDTAWHTYCARPTLAEVPRGAWRCERCRRCLVCGTRDTIAWCDNYTECAPCASLVMCCVCSEPYSDGELIIQCETCNRWLHASCDAIRSENDAELCCRAGYKCVLCRGREIPPPHITRAIEPAPTPALAPAPRPPPRPTPLSLGLAGEYYVDDVCLSQRGAHHMKQLEAEMGVTHTRRKRRFKNENADKDAVVQNADAEMTDDAKPDSTAEGKDEPAGAANTQYKEGILWNVANDGPPPEGFTLYTTDSGLTVLRRKRQRNLNKLGIGGFVVRQRQTTLKAQADEEKEGDGTQAGESPSNKRKPRRKPRSKLMEQFPPYMQEAFFGKELLEPAKPAVTSTATPAESPTALPRPPTPEGYRELRDFKIDLDNSDSEGEDVLAALSATTESDPSFVITLNQEEIEVMNTLKAKEDTESSRCGAARVKLEAEEGPLRPTEDSTALRNAILGPQPDEPAPADQPAFSNAKTDTVSETGGSSQASTISPKDDLSLLGVNLDAIRDTLPDMDSNDVDEIFKGVLTDDSQESQESSVSYVNSMGNTPYSQPRPQLQSPMDTYPSPYHTDFGSSSNSALSPLFSEGGGAAWADTPQAPPPSYNQRSAEKMRADETLGSAATISAVLYANTNHPEWKTEFPNWVDRCKQILKKWRALPSDQKSPYLQRARDNRSAIRMKKAQQEQDRTCGAVRSAREAEQERQWKHLQQQRQQQTQQQQQIIHDQRMQDIPIIPIAAMQRLRAPDGSTSPGVVAAALPAAEAPRSAFPAARFPLHCGNDDINRQLRDLLQRHPDKWPQQGEGMEGGAGPEGQQFRPPLPVGMRPRHPMLPSQRPEQHLIMHQRIVTTESQMQQAINQGQVQQQVMEVQKTNVIVQPSAVNEPKQEVQEQGNDEMDMGEQDTGNIGEVGDILTGLGGEDDEELLESLTAEIGEQFNILEYADPELAALNDAEHILDGLELADDVPERHAKREPEDESEQAQDNKMYNELQKAVKNIENKPDVKAELEDIKPEDVKQEPPSAPPPLTLPQMYGDGVQRVITPNQQLAIQNAMQAIKSEVKLESDDKPPQQQQQQRPVFMPFGGQQRLQIQHPQQQGAGVVRTAQFPGAAPQRPMVYPHNMHFTQGSASGGNVTQSAGVAASNINTQSIVNAMTAQVQAALASGRCITPGTRLVGADGAVGIVRADRTVALSHLPYAATGARAPPPPPYPGTLRTVQQPPPPPYPQEQPLLLEELLEQEKREQEREGGEWGARALLAEASPRGADARVQFPAPRAAGPRPAVSPLHVQAQSPLHSLAPHSPLHHLASPMQSPLHSQQSPLHHAAQSPHHPSTQSPLHAQQSPLHSQQSPMLVQQANLSQQSPMHPQQSPMHPQQSPMHSQQSSMHSQQSPMQSPMHQQSQMHPQQSPMHPQQSPMHPQQSPMHSQQSQMSQHSPMHSHQSPMHSQQSPMHMQQSPMHMQQSPMHTQPSPMQPAMSPQHFLQQLQAQRTSPQLPAPSRSPQIYQQSQIQSPVTSNSPQMQNVEYGGARFPRPAPGCSPLPSRFARPPHHQQGMRVGGPYGQRQQTSPLGSPQPMPSPGNPANEMARVQMARQQYSPMGVAPASPSVARSPCVARAGTPAASPAASPAPWPPDDRRRHITKVSILKRRRFAGKTAAADERADDDEEYAGSPAARAERIATEEDFEELIDGGAADEPEPAPARTETATKTVAVISLSGAPPAALHQYKLLSPARLPLLADDVAQATVASVSIANQTISVPVLKSLALPGGARPPPKKPAPLASVLGVLGGAGAGPVITLATPGPPARLPAVLAHHQVKQKIVKTIERPMALSLGGAKLSSLAVSHDATLPAKIFQDEAASPDSTVAPEPERRPRDLDIESEISRHTELPHAHSLRLAARADIKSPDPVPEKIPDNIMEGDDDDRPDDEPPRDLLLRLARAPDPPAPADDVAQTIKAIANQTKAISYAAGAGATEPGAEVAHESVQISIPSPTPSQERYLDDMTMREHAADPADAERKRVESFEDMLCMLDDMAAPRAPAPEPARAAPPQLSPLSQPADLTSTMADVSQQLRTIMSSLNPNAPKPEPAAGRKGGEGTAPTQVNFENLLPSSKVEVAAARPSPGPRPERPAPAPEPALPPGVAHALGARMGALASMAQLRKSPAASPLGSPAGQAPPLRSPAPSPLAAPPGYAGADDAGPGAGAAQLVQMPALSRIQCGAAPPAAVHAGGAAAPGAAFQKSQPLPTSILGHTLLQPTRQMTAPSHAHYTQSISSSQPPALVMTSRPSLGSKELAPNVTVRTHAIVGPGAAQAQGKQPPPGSINFINASKLLHSQLTSPLKRSKSTDEPKSEVIVGHIQPTKRHSVEAVVVKSEPMETDEPATAGAGDAAGSKAQGAAGQRNNNDESQNVLLKQLLQTTTTAAAAVPQRAMSVQRTAPALGSIPSLEAQLARPSIPPPTLGLAHDVDISKAAVRHVPVVSTTFAARPVHACIPSSTISMHTHTTQSLMDVRKTPMKVMSKEEHPQLPTPVHAPMPETSPTMKSMQMYPMSVENQQIHQAIKKEIAPPQQSPVHRPFTPMDVKKELLDESSQQSATSGVSTASDQGKLDQPMKEEYPETVTMDPTSEANAPETPSEAKKRKRREYQQKKRKQMQMNMKAAAENSLNAANAKKRPRKGSRYEEDYDTFIDNLMAQLRSLPTMQIQEPALTTNFAVCPLFGSGDLTKLKNKDYDLLKGDLTGEFGNAKIPNVADYYNTKPFGDEEPLPEKPAASTQRGFYDQEFQPIVFDEDPEDKKLDFICKERDTDTPDSIVSCSSPECLDIEPANRFPGLKLIDDEEEDEDSDSASGRVSPAIPLIAPVPIRVKPVSLFQLKEEDDNQKALKPIDASSPNKVKMEDSPGSTESNENVTVTLTLTSGAAEDILGVLKELAGILHIPPPTAYQIIERTATPPSHKLGLYRSKGKDGKEGTPIDIQSILNGAAKFCRHCDVVILDSVVRAKASEFPLLSANKGNAGEILCDSESELFFCSTQCYERFAWRPTNIILDGKSKAAVKEDSNKSDNDTNMSKERDDFDTASTESMETDDLDIKPDIKDEKMDLSFMDSLDNDELMKEVGDDVSALDEDLKSVEQDEKSNQSTEKEKYRGVRYKAWSPGCIGPPVKYKRPTDRELTELVFRTGVAIMPVTTEDARRCELCGLQGDGVADGVSRLLNCDVDRWVHLNCALWSEGVYETVSGALMNVETALAAGSNATCAVCRRLGATVRCFKVRCGSVYHLGCAVKDGCVFYKNKSAFCASHAPKNEKDNELTTLSVQRRVYVSRDEQRQVASVMLHSDTNHLIRVGGLIFLSPGHLLPHQLAAFHTPNYIYPIGYKIVRFYWSMVRAVGRCRYLCWISEEEGRPRFHVRAQDEPKHECSAATPRAAWANILDAVAALREGRNEDGVLKLWPNYVTGEDLFGLTEPAVVRVLESLPGIETLTDYRFKFGRSALLEGGLAVNPSGCARAEPRGRTAWRRAPRALAPAAGAHLPPAPAADAAHPPVCPYTKQFIHTKSSQYKKMKLEWRNNVYLARSKIQGLGLYAARDLEKHTMVIEYIGEIIRSELSEIREKQYEDKNRGIYMFRLDERRVVDATLSGGLARYINHSCQPNCVAETIEVDRNLRIIIFAKRRIARGEELAYDYKFDIEDDAHKIMCMCGAPNCRKWMN